MCPFCVRLGPPRWSSVQQPERPAGETPQEPGLGRVILGFLPGHMLLQDDAKGGDEGGQKGQDDGHRRPSGGRAMPSSGAVDDPKSTSRVYQTRAGPVGIGRSAGRRLRSRRVGDDGVVKDPDLFDFDLDRISRFNRCSGRRRSQ